MAAGGWLAGLLYDRFGFYGAAFLVGVMFNLANLLIVGALVLRRQHTRRRATFSPA
jgi:predicted MFS family arabinose efflux permease